MTQYHAGKVKMVAHVVRPGKRTEYCEHKWLEGGELVQCGEPTKGHTYCPDCLHQRSTAPNGSRYSSFVGPAFGMSRRMGSAA